MELMTTVVRADLVTRRDLAVFEETMMFRLKVLEYKMLADRRAEELEAQNKRIAAQAKTLLVISWACFFLIVFGPAITA
jgi:hypothetical protein